MISLAHEICVQIVKMEAVKKNGGGNRLCSGYLTQVIQYKLATEFGSFVFLVTGNLGYKCQFMCRDGSRVNFPCRLEC